MAHVDKVYSASTKKWPLLARLLPSYVLVTWQQSAPESEKLRWVNNDCKSNE